MTDSDDENLNEDETLNRLPPFPDECHNEANSSESFNACFTRRFNACPVFFAGSLQDACREAFHPANIEERRPVLIYIHNDKSIFSNVFCSNIFCAPTIIDYLLENYLVWPWDITFESNRNTLRSLWLEMFSSDLFDTIPAEQCPRLIGIMRLFVEETNGSFQYDYQFRTLLECDTLTRTKQKSSRETLRDELIIFKKECNYNEHALSLDIRKKTGLCQNVTLEIAKYLSLNDAINVFSSSILSELRQRQTQVHISESSSDQFIKMILRNLNPKQIVSLRLNSNSIRSKSRLLSFTTFTEVLSLTLLNARSIDLFGDTIFFPKLIRLSLWYDHEVNLITLVSGLTQFRKPIKRLEIHCAGILCAHSYGDQFGMQSIANVSMEYFLLDVGHCPLVSRDECSQHYQSCSLMTIIRFCRKIYNIRYIRIMTHKNNLDKLLDDKQWTNLVEGCHPLKKVTVFVLGNSSHNGESKQKVLEVRKVIQVKQYTNEFLND